MPARNMTSLFWHRQFPVIFMSLVSSQVFRTVVRRQRVHW